jgi:hypothetical protein
LPENMNLGLGTNAPVLVEPMLFYLPLIPDILPQNIVLDTAEAGVHSGGGWLRGTN